MQQKTNHRIDTDQTNGKRTAMILGHTIELAPNNKRATYFNKACGVARFAYNWVLAEW